MGLQMTDEWIEARILGNDMKKPTGVLSRQDAQIVGKVEIQGITAGGIEHHIAAPVLEALHGKNQIEG